jgi:pyruvate/2-oxoglutarate dehydrogenase complex dihydrolipoamide acyltransferase (E2) component
MQVLRVPSLAENVTEATVGRWLVAEGAAVRAGEEMAELLTEKAEFTLEAPGDGTVSAILAPPKSVLPVGAALALLDATEEEIAAARGENARRLAEHVRADPPPPPVEGGAARERAPGRPASGVRATPAARRLAKEAGADLAEIALAAGTSGILRVEDVRAWLAEREGGGA